ncbi:hypothetical protein PtA15_4A540 [Puccinia triticina]|uniref:Uncharacterized protein n=1 Tax=Puccinia triticina TaxID=208348 RepID=A0ABY7CFS8_9BASI|nr:uncharacterized protein PtA15_4A540 [Puccinia triticina]WAQ84089.1 hypothetical protein PtA15_4A540 [Puccinia triticina]
MVAELDLGATEPAISVDMADTDQDAVDTTAVMVEVTEQGTVKLMVVRMVQVTAEVVAGLAWVY